MTQRDFTLAQVFDEALGRHLERLLGTRYGIGGLPLTLGTLSCIILVSQKATNDQDLSSGNPERYTVSTLCRELGELGLGPEPAMKATVQDMIQKGYMDLEDQGTLCPARPAAAMARLLDETFPKMAGMSLLAYLVQILGEAHCGRKTLELAVSQFNQTLRTHGVPLRKPVKPPVNGSGERRAPENANRRITGGKGPRLSRLMDASHSMVIPSPRAPHRESPGPSSRADRKRSLIRQVEIVEASLPPRQPVKTASDLQGPGSSNDETVLPPSPCAPSEEKPSASDPFSESLPVPPTVPVPEPAPILAAASEHGTEPSREYGSPEMSATPSPAPEPSPEKPWEGPVVAFRREGDFDPADRDPGGQPTALEQDPALKCPVCKTGHLDHQETATGTTYYRCLAKDCNFISWGRPHHLLCPRCGNPFLVETAGRGGEIILRCPRATCRYWRGRDSLVTQESQGSGSGTKEAADTGFALGRPKRRVTRRRVARRKR